MAKITTSLFQVNVIMINQIHKVITVKIIYIDISYF